MNGLDLMAKWLMPSPDTSKPSKFLLSKIFDIIRGLYYIESVHLKASIIGKYIMHIYRKSGFFYIYF